jgi:stage II sporulation protein P
MKLKVAAAGLLCLCFGYLALLSGAVPVMAQSQEMPSPSPEPAQEALAAVEPIATATPAPVTPEPTAIPTEAPPTQDAATPQPEATASTVTVIPTTITGDSLIDNDTYYDIDPQTLLEEADSLSLPAEGYQILIIHTHATEAYTPDGDDTYEASDEYRTTDTSQSVVRVGDELAQALETYGLHVLHDTGLYDYPSYNGSYVRCGEAIEEYLAAYPGISLVIDLHRDALGSGDTIYKTITQEAGQTAAQIMLVMGTDVNLEHPRWQQNLATALTLQTAAAQQFETLMRPTVVCNYRYNQQLSTGCLLMEVGTAGNTLQEAIAGVKLFAQAVGPLLAQAVS